MAIKTFFVIAKKSKRFSIYSLSIIILGIQIISNIATPIVSAKDIKDLYKQTSSKKSFVTEAIRKSAPAVVTIETQKRVLNNHRNIMPRGLLIDPYFERFFGMPNMNYPRSSIQRGQGSGVIFSSKGYILTNAHVVENIDTLTIGLSDGRRVSGRLIGQDSLTDLAVIKIDQIGRWPKASLGDSSEIEVGDWAIAVGNPYGLEKTVTLGIISNLNRNVNQLGISDKRLNLIQTDAAINPGNSGGPLLNSDGEVIGINTLVRSGPGAGLGFAIPINTAISIANQLVSIGKAIHPMIGVNLSYRNDYLRVNKKNKGDLKGAVIIYILPGGPAYKKGLNINDIIISVNGKEIIGPNDVVKAISNNGIKEAMAFTIIRNQRKLKFYITPTDLQTLKPR
ncbi:trypsin-like peptidase domain-containing protein [Prochlorococcus marinus]|uniref:trypsin-like peptidase domain-containing protein n=1 Tax=Prochlorococcus marinus TaxID=1219 RepID=UPI0022B4E499|nr:trypsin-like peptidase domain-containing protein [Prochlorococcus marinus]